MTEKEAFIAGFKAARSGFSSDIYTAERAWEIHLAKRSGYHDGLHPLDTTHRPISGAVALKAAQEAKQ